MSWNLRSPDSKVGTNYRRSFTKMSDMSDDYASDEKVEIGTASVGVSTKAKNLQLITSTAESVKFAREKNKLKNLQILQSAGEPADLTREEKEFREKNLQIVTSTGEAVRFARQKNKAKKGNAAIEAVAAGKSKEGSGNDDKGKGKGKA
ncbi:hypothetical protein LOZ57_003873 [Ophidiomyces ophidiicola]|uniref:uncharacterized protein n=1 Tax=Ophidiomyces ophidiicola TaxID=1387563 RepID=UPI0020C1DD5C|nr:uncharacterized protein LOZ57_003873 [Ophidiomyces ophidiicola]KAI1946121.1 hypothetical protein LOZ57_003873 [Ophidiomyces ophidiicola]KAI2050100.1 hypothetical protein LOZ43_004993 [Ophidiomyces ophidiicola]